jgi:peptidoglycan/xylan/chitin deacetylase (PgdA/CDA1 family)
MTAKLVVLFFLILVSYIFFNKFVTAITPAQTGAIVKKVAVMPSPTPTPTIKPSPTPIPFYSNTTGKSFTLPILTYHYIGNNPNPKDTARDNLSVSPDKFDAQMGYLAQNGYTPITFDTLYVAMTAGGALPTKPVILTFDDGYIDFYINAYPILRKYNFKAVSFIPTGLMDTGYYLHWSQIKEMQSSGLISFEAHSVHHSNLTALSSTDLKYEITESKRKLEEETGTKVNFFAYPYGSSNAYVWQAVKEAGYQGAVGTWSGKSMTPQYIFNLPRIKIAGQYSLQEFIAHL